MIEKPLRREPESREDMPLYKNCGLSVEARLKDLLSRMTIQEKVAQLGTLDPNKLKQHLKNGVGRRHVQGGRIDSRQETTTQDTL